MPTNLNSLTGGVKPVYDESAGLQRVLNLLVQNHFQFSNKFMCKFVFPKQLADYIARNIGFDSAETFFAYVKSTNLPNLNIATDTVNTNGFNSVYPTGFANKDKIQVAFWNDNYAQILNILSYWRSMVANYYPSYVGYKDDFVGKLLVYTFRQTDEFDFANAGIDTAASTSFIDKVASASKEVGKFAIRNTGLTQFSSNEPLILPDKLINMNVNFLRIYNEVYPDDLQANIHDKSEDASIVLLQQGFVWSGYKDYFNPAQKWSFNPMMKNETLI